MPDTCPTTAIRVILWTPDAAHRAEGLWRNVIAGEDHIDAQLTRLQYRPALVRSKEGWYGQTTDFTTNETSPYQDVYPGWSADSCFGWIS
jgi:hypothetical protein